ncbi:MAG: PAS domain-containing sensor histidine kinase [Actinomycetota bacterium]
MGTRLSPAHFSHAYLAFSGLLIGIYFVAPSPLAKAIIYDSLVASGGLAVIAGTRIFRPAHSGAWYLIGASALLKAAGDVTWDVYEQVLKQQVPLPSWADVFYLASYPLLLIGLGLLVRTTLKRGFDGLLDGVIVALVVLVLFTEQILGLALESQTSLALLVASSYVLFDLALIGLVAQFFLSGLRTPSAWLMLASLIAVLMGDVVFAALGERYKVSGWVDATWQLGSVLLGAAALHPSMTTLSKQLSTLSPRLTRRSLAFALLALAALPAGVLTSPDQFGTTEFIQVAARLLLLVSVGVRLIRLVSMNESSEARLNLIIASSADAIVYGKLDGTVEETNPAAEQLFGWKRSEGLGGCLNAALAQTRKLEGEPEEQRTAEVVMKGHRPDGSRYLAAAKITFAGRDLGGGWVMVARDSTTHLVNAAAAQALSEDLDLERAFSALTLELGRVIGLQSLLVVLLDPDGRCTPAYLSDPTLWPERAEVRLSPAKSGGLEVQDFVLSSGSQPEFIKQLDLGPCVILPISYMPGELIALVILKFGGSELVPATVQLARSLQATVERSVRNMISFRRQKDRNLELEELDKLKFDFLRMIGHDLRAPLAAIRVGVEVLVDQGNSISDERRRRLSTSLIYGANALERLVADAVDASQMVDSRFPCQLSLLSDPADALQRACERFCDEHPRVNWSFSTLPPVMADEARLQQVMVNLISNALKYSADDMPVSVKGWSTGTHVQVRVDDRGPGIPKDQLHLLFQRFSRLQTDNANQPDGTGIGLYIARGIVESHGGKLWVESILGEGSCFFFSLPVALEAGPKTA